LAQSTPSAVVVSNGWPIKTFAMNNLGSVVFAGGLSPWGADGLVLVNSAGFRKFVSIGDPAPGFDNKVFVGFLLNDSPADLLSLNDRDEVAFVGAAMTCANLADVYGCLSSGEPYFYGLYVYSKGSIAKIVGVGDEAPDTGGRRIAPLINQLWFN